MNADGSGGTSAWSTAPVSASSSVVTAPFYASEDHASPPSLQGYPAASTSRQSAAAEGVISCGVDGHTTAFPVPLRPPPPPQLLRTGASTAVLPTLARPFAETHRATEGPSHPVLAAATEAPFTPLRQSNPLVFASTVPPPQKAPAGATPAATGVGRENSTSLVSLNAGATPPSSTATAGAADIVSPTHPPTCFDGAAGEERFSTGSHCAHTTPPDRDEDEKEEEAAEVPVERVDGAALLQHQLTYRQRHFPLSTLTATPPSFSQLPASRQVGAGALHAGMAPTEGESREVPTPSPRGSHYTDTRDRSPSRSPPRTPPLPRTFIFPSQPTVSWSSGSTESAAQPAAEGVSGDSCPLPPGARRFVPFHWSEMPSAAPTTAALADTPPLANLPSPRALFPAAAAANSTAPSSDAATAATGPSSESEERRPRRGPPSTPPRDRHPTHWALASPGTAARRSSGEDSLWLALHRSETPTRRDTALSSLAVPRSCLGGEEGREAARPAAPLPAAATMLEVGSLLPCSLLTRALLTGHHADVVLAVTQTGLSEGKGEEEEKEVGAAVGTAGGRKRAARRRVTLFRAHRLVLASRSPFFEALLYHNGDGVVFPDGKRDEGSGAAEFVDVRTLRRRASRNDTATSRMGGAREADGALVPVLHLCPQPSSAGLPGDAPSSSDAFPLTPRLLAAVLVYLYTGTAPILAKQGAAESSVFVKKTDQTPGEAPEGERCVAVAPSVLGRRHGKEYVQMLWASEYFMLPALTTALRAALPDFLRATSVWPVLQEARRLGLLELAGTVETWTRRHVWELLCDTSSVEELEPEQVATLIHFHHRRLLLPVPGENRERSSPPADASTRWRQTCSPRSPQLIAPHESRQGERDEESEGASHGGSPCVTAGTLPPEAHPLPRSHPRHGPSPSRASPRRDGEPLRPTPATTPRSLLVPAPLTLHLMGDVDEAEARQVATVDPALPPSDVASTARGRGERRRLPNARGRPIPSMRSASTSAGSPSGGEPARPAASAAAAGDGGSSGGGGGGTPAAGTALLSQENFAANRSAFPVMQGPAEAAGKGSSSCFSIPAHTLSMVVGVSAAAVAAEAVPLPPCGVLLGPAPLPSHRDGDVVRLLSGHPLRLTPAAARMLPASFSSSSAPAPLGPRGPAALTETDVTRTVLRWWGHWQRRGRDGGRCASPSNEHEAASVALATTVGVLHWQLIDADLLQGEVVPLVQSVNPQLLPRATGAGTTGRQ